MRALSDALKINEKALRRRSETKASARDRSGAPWLARYNPNEDEPAFCSAKHRGRSLRGALRAWRPNIARRVTSIVDRLERAKARPLLVETAVRTALHDALAWRIGGGSPPDAQAFVAAAVAAARRTIDAIDADAAERSRTLGPVQNAARCFGTSTLYRRLMTVPTSRLVGLRHSSNGPDAIVRDVQRRLHAIALTLGRDAFDAGRTATAIARTAPLCQADRLRAITVHIYSLTTGQRQAFARDVHDTSAARVA